MCMLAGVLVLSSGPSRGGLSLTHLGDSKCDFLKNPLLINPLYLLTYFGSASRSKLLAQGRC